MRGRSSSKSHHAHALRASTPVRRGTGLRIIAGTLKGRRIASAAWEGLRPTSDRLRETLFNVLAEEIVGARVLDGFAGTGAVGLEALSRGARHVTFADRDRRTLDLIADNIDRCGLTGGYTIVRADLDGGSGEPFTTVFDVVLLDPPYGMDPTGALRVVAPSVVPGGLLVLEHATRDTPPEVAADLRHVRRVTAGDSTLSFYRRGPQSAAGSDE